VVQPGLMIKKNGLSCRIWRMSCGWDVYLEGIQNAGDLRFILRKYL